MDDSILVDFRNFIKNIKEQNEAYDKLSDNGKRTVNEVYKYYNKTLGTPQNVVLFLVYSGVIRSTKFKSYTDLATCLILARIAKGFTVKEVEDRLKNRKEYRQFKPGGYIYYIADIAEEFLKKYKEQSCV